VEYDLRHDGFVAEMPPAGVLASAATALSANTRTEVLSPDTRTDHTQR
jgi:hypothetical protein